MKDEQPSEILYIYSSDSSFHDAGNIFTTSWSPPDYSSATSTSTLNSLLFDDLSQFYNDEFEVDDEVTRPVCTTHQCISPINIIDTATAEQPSTSGYVNDNNDIDVGTDTTILYENKNKSKSEFSMSEFSGVSSDTDNNELLFKSNYKILLKRSKSKLTLTGGVRKKKYTKKRKRVKVKKD